MRENKAWFGTSLADRQQALLFYFDPQFTCDLSPNFQTEASSRDMSRPDGNKVILMESHFRRESF